MNIPTQRTSKKSLIVIVGPTAIGKTDLSVKLAKHYQTEIISADSRQFYKEMSIGTAKPTDIEMDEVKHHFVDFLSVEEDFSAGQFERQALEVIENIHEKSQYAVMVGGSGLFVDAVCNGLDPVPKDLKIRAALNERFEQDGLVPLVEELTELDIEVTKEVDLKNPMRVIRALEVCLATGKTYSSYRKKEPKVRSFDIVKIGLNTERERLYDRINQRCDIMMKEGWEAEARLLIPFKTNNALNTVGYKELFQYFDGDIDYGHCIELIKQHTRNFAKRQLTWFNKDKKTTWIDPLSSDPEIEARKVISALS